MKRIFLGAMAFVALLFSSCEKNESTSTPQDLIGIWQVESVSVEGSSVTIPLDDCSKKTAFVFTQTQATFYDFEKDTARNLCKYDIEGGPYVVKGNLIYDAEDRESFPFSISGNTLTLTKKEDGVSFVMKFKKITQDQLDASLASANKGGGNNNGSGNNNGGENNNGGGNNNGGNNNGSGNNNGGKVIANLEGIWQIVSETENDVIEQFDNCEKKASIKISGNQILYYDFEQKPIGCVSEIKVKNFTVSSDTTIEVERKRHFISITGDNLTLTTVENGRKKIIAYKRITQAQLDALLR